MFTNRTTILLLLFTCGFGFFSPAAAMNQKSTLILQQTITTLHKARLNIVRSNRKHAEQVQPTETDRKDFLLFLSYLDGRIYYYCQELSQSSGPDALAGLPCPVASDNPLETSQYAPVPTASDQTNEEKISALDDGFNAALGEFDDMLLKEQEQIASNIPRQREGSGSGGSGSAQGTGKGQGSRGGNGKNGGDSAISTGKNEPKGMSRSPTGTASSRGTGVGSTRQSRLPPTAGNKDLSQSDDDIVARQLKEAAEQETDPEVKAKLWEEYRKYKEGTQ